MNKLLRMEEVAEILNVSEAMAYRLCRRGELPSVHLGKAVRVRPEDLEKYVESKVSLVV